MSKQENEWELPCMQCGQKPNDVGRMAFKDICYKCYNSNWESQFSEGLPINDMGKRFRTARCKQCGITFKRGGIRSHLHYKHNFDANKVRKTS